MRRAIKDTVAFDLKAAREARSLNQTDAAAVLLTTQSSVARWEVSGKIPNIYREYWLLYWKEHDNSSRNKVSAKSVPSKSKTKVVARKRPALDTPKLGAE